MNRNGGLPLHAGNGRTSGYPSALGSLTKLKPRRLAFLIGFAILTLLTLNRIFSSSESNHVEVDRAEQARSEAEREAAVQKILQTRKSAFSFSDFTEEGLVLPENDHLLPATAILLGWKRLDGLRLIVNYLARYPYIKQIIVWNNNLEVRLTDADFHFDSQYGTPPELMINNSGENLHDLAKYMSCSLAKYEHCYFQDDDWLNTHMDSLYSNFLNSPSLIHTTTLPMINIEHRRWSFTNEGKHDILARRDSKLILIIFVHVLDRNQNACWIRMDGHRIVLASQQGSAVIGTGSQRQLGQGSHQSRRYVFFDLDQPIPIPAHQRPDTLGPKEWMEH